jgi:Xaa-Pro dipeptidase
MLRFSRALWEKGAAAGLVTHPRDLFYLVGTAQPANLLLRPDREPVLFARRFFDRVRAEAFLDDVRRSSALDPLAALLGDEPRPGPLALALDVIPAGLASKTQNALRFDEVCDYSPVLMRQRAVKGPDEISAIRQSAEIFAAADETIRHRARPGMTERELAAHVSRAVRLAGHDGHVFYRRWDACLQPEGIVTSGPNATALSGHAMTITGIGASPALPFGASDRALAQHDLLTIDIGLFRAGYHADIARSYSLGTPSAAVAKVVAAVEAAHAAALAAVVPGAPASAAYHAAQESVEDAGFSEFFQGHGDDQGHYVGHGVGIELDDLPVLGPTNAEPLAEGMVLAIEPKLMVPGVGAVVIEDTVLVGPNGPEVLSPVASEVRIIAC